MNETDDVIDRADNLNKRIEERIPEIKVLVQYAEQSKRLSRIAIVFSVILACVVIFIGISAVRISNNTDNAVRAKDMRIALADDVRHACEANNTDKAGNLSYWQFILAVPGSAQLFTPGERTVALEIINRVFAPTNCDQLIADVVTP